MRHSWMKGQVVQVDFLRCIEKHLRLVDESIRLEWVCLGKVDCDTENAVRKRGEALSFRQPTFF